MSFKPAIMTGVFSELKPEASIKRLAGMGWRYFEFYSVHMAEMNKRKDPAKHFSALRELCEKLGVCILAAHDNTKGVPPERFIQWAQILGVETVVLHPRVEETKEGNLEMLRGWLPWAERFEIRMAVENMHDMIPDIAGRRAFGATPSELLWLAEKTNPEFVGVCWDINHAHVQKLDQYRAIKQLGKHLVHTHINDTTTDSEEQHLLPFEGKVDWKTVIKALKEINYQGLFSLEAGVSVNSLPLPLRDLKLRYALELTEMMIECM
ncbi:MAG: sugar phosphate isomerase/epimerase [Candidatus Latescibacteria bacterium]|nr:sugar phosphate isomerase/epimerase [Candidatus Latescibacterota bacterium]